jgi:hypothetical protein
MMGSINIEAKNKKKKKENQQPGRGNAIPIFLKENKKESNKVKEFTHTPGMLSRRVLKGLYSTHKTFRKPQQCH